VQRLPTLVFKALTDSGYDLIAPAANGWFIAGISGLPAKVAVWIAETNTVPAVSESGFI
jgi:hypothetical protein